MTLTEMSIPVIAALIGWVTNYIAVKMIFRPRVPINILGFRLWGLVPKRQKELAQSIGETVEEKLISHKDVQEVLQHPKLIADAEHLISEEIDRFMKNFALGNPMVGMFLQGELAAQVKGMVTDQIKAGLPSFLDRMMVRVEGELDFKEIIRKKIEGFDLSTLEGIIYRISAKELKTIELLGGVLGFFVGIAQLTLVKLGM